MPTPPEASCPCRVAMLASWRKGRLAPTWRFQIGLLIVGWAVFDLVEGVVDHHILGVHHVRDDLGGPLSWDLGFLGGESRAARRRMGDARRWCA